MEEHISRILKMLEEGKISATEAQTLISALKADPPPGAPTSQPRAADGNSSARAESPPREESGKAKSFEFEWSQRKAFPFDLSGLGKQISDAVKKIDPEKMVREARAGFQKGGKRFNERFKGWAFFGDGEDGRPENVSGHPTARTSETIDLELKPDSLVQMENSFGSIAVFGGAESARVEIDKEAWAPVEEEAEARLKELMVETNDFSPDIGIPRLEVKVTGPEQFRDGFVNLRLHVPDSVALRLGTIFGEIRVENQAGAVEAHTISGAVSFDNLKGDARAEGISGDMRAANIGGALNLASKSGNIRAESLSRGATVTCVSGDISITGVEGGRLEAKSVSGDVKIEKAGKESPLDLTAESVSGDISLKGAGGNITLKTVSGDVSGDELNALTLQAQTVSGDVKVSLTAPFAGTLSTNTVSGDVSIAAPTGSNFRFSIGTQSGDLSCDYEAHDTTKTDTLWTGTIGTGTGNVNIQTRTGDVKLAKAP